MQSSKYCKSFAPFTTDYKFHFSVASTLWCFYLAWNSCRWSLTTNTKATKPTNYRMFPKSLRIPYKTQLVYFVNKSLLIIILLHTTTTTATTNWKQFISHKCLVDPALPPSGINSYTRKIQFLMKNSFVKKPFRPQQWEFLRHFLLLLLLFYFVFFSEPKKKCENFKGKNAFSNGRPAPNTQKQMGCQPSSQADQQTSGPPKEKSRKIWKNKNTSNKIGNKTKVNIPSAASTLA